MECINNLGIYRIGHSKNTTINYGKNADEIFVTRCINAKVLEAKIISKFNELFEKSHGNKYFKGDKLEMMSIILHLVYEHTR